MTRDTTATETVGQSTQSRARRGLCRSSDLNRWLNRQCAGTGEGVGAEDAGTGFGSEVFDVGAGEPAAAVEHVAGLAEQREVEGVVIDEEDDGVGAPDLVLHRIDALDVRR